ncbi:dimethylaniline monooxygenase (N-oxide forming) [Angomonas deanei]|uniref:Pyridine nucleotide-disulphide oxidoreductase/Flavin-binding monooxygenase-like/NAD(P)-binding Rossmann-like domain/L-lysine 6-monooxygenase (NADPH-requiring), putative n=1 Tax=Angomonas deanei TaxID=59799 RepID=A0A7G2CPS0_9TRYP|nr:dimethylaniline monooxygenase (N-oxide forming) [Angomonas deanei]CAD2221828.1 Pyridine nucleotide-disulphide oxidoreductase/Flavin-binding monooxygenase-like/NAD(P)-binding Rossmann-like domain/L-lysine 6-monooxygenase (NADPH-requiring), putative [Angomonas deanei]|eukprot:EPY18061.1 dimethylaniline monooxygenase (N-oxide forming) [Angomonas deanei]
MRSCAVIGCGPAGMAACAALRQNGLLVTCFDMHGEPGGMWSYNSRDLFSGRGCISPVFPSMRCILPKDLMSFSDVRFDYTAGQFLHHTMVKHYLTEQYAAQKGIRDCTRFNTKVESVRRAAQESTSAEGSPSWKLVTVNVKNGDVMEWSFDYVCVCTGQTHEVRFPTKLREETLKDYVASGGELHHSAYVKDFRSLRHKRVAVIGDGVSAYNMCSELRKFGADVIHSSMVPPSKATISPTESRKARSKPPSKMVTEVRDVVTTFVEMCNRLPGWRNNVFQANQMILRWMRYSVQQMKEVKHVGKPLKSFQDSKDILFAPDPSRVHSLEEIIKESQLRHLSNAKKEQETADNDQEGELLTSIDTVISATGYTIRFPFLHPSVRKVVEEDTMLLLTGETAAEAGKTSLAQRRGLYMGTLYNEEPTLAFIGTQKELLPPFLMFEAQARFIAFCFSQRVEVPPTPALRLEKEKEWVSVYEEGLRHLRREATEQSGGAEENWGLHSAAYYNILQQMLEISSRDTYTTKIMERKKWFFYSALVRIYNKFRSMAPLKRKKTARPVQQ